MKYNREALAKDFDPTYATPNSQFWNIMNSLEQVGEGAVFAHAVAGLLFPNLRVTEIQEWHINVARDLLEILGFAPITKHAHQYRRKADYKYWLKK
ncbi:hypothetical protein PT277_04745 [Acetobacteraceae bacterium ESL0709]|nr:hypothetical protein [Acetobacteraceae bacterium ESL0697]MDF7678003.1 hypothetical protein [Acetobacteraceae bacterium ESL0709]